MTEELEKLSGYYQEGKLAHAYLISTNNNVKTLKVLLKVIKNIFCVQKYSDNCNKCSLCHLIDINNLPSLKIISPEGNLIKKEQIQELKHLFSKSSQYTKESIYIILNAEKMNKEAANTMLKFLEEPDGNVIGFFLTNEKENVLLTIQSRCQLIDVNFENKDFEKYNLTTDEYCNYLNLTTEYLRNLEDNKDSILINNGLIDYEKKDIIIFFKLCLTIYNQELESRFVTNINCDENFKFLNKFSNENLEEKIKLIVEILKEIQYNVNVNLLLDKFVLKMEGVNNEII